MIYLFIIENTWTDIGSRVVQPHGWGNGYVAVPKDHPWYQLYLRGESIEREADIDIHGGITYVSDFMPGYSPYGNIENNHYLYIGFDTAHYSDNSLVWTKQKVKEETLKLYHFALMADKYYMKRSKRSKGSK